MIIKEISLIKSDVKATCIIQKDAPDVSIHDLFYCIVNKKKKYFEVIQMDIKGHDNVIILEQTGYYQDRAKSFKESLKLRGAVLMSVDEKDEIEMVKRSSRYC